MHASSKPSVLAHRRHPISDPRGRDPSPERGAAATSGTFRAVRPTPAELLAPTVGEPPLDSAKVEGLRFELDIGIWRSDSERVAQHVLDDAECVTEGDAIRAEACGHPHVADVAEDGQGGG